MSRPPGSCITFSTASGFSCLRVHYTELVSFSFSLSLFLGLLDDGDGEEGGEGRLSTRTSVSCLRRLGRTPTSADGLDTDGDGQRLLLPITTVPTRFVRDLNGSCRSDRPTGGGSGVWSRLDETPSFGSSGTLLSCLDRLRRGEKGVRRRGRRGILED